MSFDGIQPNQHVGYTNPLGYAAASQRAKLNKHELLDKVKEGLGVEAVHREDPHADPEGKKHHHASEQEVEPHTISPELRLALEQVLGITLDETQPWVLVFDETNHQIFLINTAQQSVLATLTPEQLLSVMEVLKQSASDKSGLLTDRSI